MMIFIVQQHDGTDYYLVRAKLAVLDKQFKLAENIYLDQVNNELLKKI